MLPKSVVVLHSKILSLIIRDGETPDEERLLDDDTWPEVMRQVIPATSICSFLVPFSDLVLSWQHLEDTYGELADYSRLIDQLTSKEYCDIDPNLRLQALVTLVHDCLQTKTLR